ncbi:MFS transporter [Lutimonas zeaxanthinifaciens]|uniref:MFS transporter n=1 Tax=Lutimonas zeaxanthinifaciens TaxID=3060215 RepID=UPI00265CA46E|nr:MFS transporter [Lutimonas sp. YSD2104]WKK65322.1 MFS transporter [Lutimonas sp. YSD2104]
MKQERTNWNPLIAIVASMVMMYITSFSINVLISPIVTDLGWSVSGLQLVIVSASLIAGSLQVTAGRLGDKLGKKKIFILGTIIYTIGLTIVVLAPNSSIFSIAWALIWPIGMVLVIPTSVALIMYFYNGSDRAKAFGIYGAVLSVVSALAPLLVGYMANFTGWRIALALSPLFGIITIFLALRMPETKKDESIKIDVVSVFLSLLSFGIFLIATTMAAQYGWLMEKRPFSLGDTPLNLGGLSIVPVMYAFAIGLLIVFLKRGKSLMAQGQSPLLDGSILKDKTFTLGAIIQSVLYFLIAAILFIISVFVQSAAGFDSFDTALATLPASIGVAIFSFFTPGLGKRILPKWIVIAGFAIVFVGIFVLKESVGIDIGPMSLLPGMLIFGVGCGLIMAQIATVTMMNIKPEDEGGASGLSETMKEIIGQGFAIAFAGAILFGGVYTNMTKEYKRVESIELTAEEENQILLELEDTFQTITEAEEQEFIQSLPEKTRDEYQNIVDNSAVKGLNGTLNVLNIFVLVSIVLAFFLPNVKLE